MSDTTALFWTLGGLVFFTAVLPISLICIKRPESRHPIEIFRDRLGEVDGFEWNRKFNHPGHDGFFDERSKTGFALSANRDRIAFFRTVRVGFMKDDVVIQILEAELITEIVETIHMATQTRTDSSGAFIGAAIGGALIGIGSATAGTIVASQAASSVHSSTYETLKSLRLAIVFEETPQHQYVFQFYDSTWMLSSGSRKHAVDLFLHWFVELKSVSQQI